jgi:hypothetical protein
MSAMPPIPTKLMGRRETSLSATKRHMQCNKFQPTDHLVDAGDDEDRGIARPSAAENYCVLGGRRMLRGWKMGVS